MSQRTLRGAIRPRLASPMRGRDPMEPGRAATPLELFFDLVVVVAVALASERLHHALIEGVGVASVVSYALVFVAIWLAWGNYTWFASAYDTDDVAYRLSVLVIMTGALVMRPGCRGSSISAISRSELPVTPSCVSRSFHSGSGWRSMMPRVAKLPFVLPSA